MTAIQILEKLGADSTFNKADLSPESIKDMIKLSENDPGFNAPIIQVFFSSEDEL